MKTLKQILFVSTLVLLTQMATAQLKFGATLGIGGATQSEIMDIYHNNNVALSYTAGLMGKNQVNNWFAVKAGFNFTKKGSRYDVDEGENTLEQSERLNYLILPVMAEFSAPVNHNKLFFATGPYLGFLLDAQNKINDTETNTKDNFKSSDFGLAYELGFIKPVSKIDLVFSLNYNMGFSHISKINDRLNNKSLTLNFGVLF